MKKYSVVLLSLFFCLYVTSAAAWSRGREVEIPNIDDVEYYITTALTATERELAESDNDEILAELNAKKAQALLQIAIVNGIREADREIPNVDDVAYYIGTALITAQKKRLEQALYKISDNMEIGGGFGAGEAQALIHQALISEIDQADIVEISLLAGGQSVEDMITFLRQEGISQNDIFRGMDAAGISFLSATKKTK